MRLRVSFTTLFLALGVAAVLVAGAAQAASISYFLDQTNDTTGNLLDGTNYLQITFTDNGNDIDVTVDVLSPPFCSTPSCSGIEEDANFGIQNVYFNDVNNTLLASEIINLPSNWEASLPGGNADGFGSFEVKVAGKGADRVNPTLSFTIQRAGDSIDSYAEGDPFFAAHVAGFVDQNPLDPLDPIDDEGLCQVNDEGDYTPECNILTSVWVAGSNPVPEPSTVLLLLGGLSGLALAGRRRLH